MSVDFSNWAVVAHKDDTGLGRQAEDIRAVLKLGHHLVIPSERLWDKPLDQPNEVVLSPEAPAERVRVLLEGLEGVFFFERHSWHPLLLSIAREVGVKTVCVPNWEWFNGTDKQWRDCDLFICGSRFSLKVVRSFGFDNSVHLPLTVDIGRFPRRTVTGPARLFIHNAGLVDQDDRKGTRDTINAFRRVNRPDVRLLVRMQKPSELPQLDSRIEVRVGNLDRPQDLYAEGDVAIQPSKMEGNGFNVIEAVLSGLPVVTLDYPPMNEFVRQKELLVRKQLLKRKSWNSVWIKHAHLRLPELGDLAKKISWCAEHDLSEISRQNRAWAEAVFERQKLSDAYAEVIDALSHNQLSACIRKIEQGCAD